MRALVACLAVVATIALPGLIVAATSSSPSNEVFRITTGQSATGSPGLPSASLMATSAAVEAALDRDGRSVVLIPEGSSQVVLQGKNSGGCPVKITLHENTGVLFAYANSCGQGKLVHGNVTIVYSPPSIGPTVRQAVANLR